MSDLKRIEIVRIKDIPEVHTVEVSYVENYEDAIRMPPGTWKDKLYPKILDGIDKCLKITCEKDRQTNNWIYTAKMHMIHPDELFLTVGKEDALKQLPSAEPKKGKWVFKRLYHEADECICSECGQLMTTAHEKRMRFCPNCGTKMEGG